MKRLALIAFLVPALALAFEGERVTSVSVTGTNARTSADLPLGILEVDCTAAVFYRMGTSSAVATTNDAPRPANVRFYVNITPDGRRLAFITSGGSGTCSIYTVNVLANSRAAGALIFGGSSAAHVVTDVGRTITNGAAEVDIIVTAGTTCLCVSWNDPADPVLGCALSANVLNITTTLAGTNVGYICTT